MSGRLSGSSSSAAPSPYPVRSNPYKVPSHLLPVPELEALIPVDAKPMITTPKWDLIFEEVADDSPVTIGQNLNNIASIIEDINRVYDTGLNLIRVPRWVQWLKAYIPALLPILTPERREALLRKYTGSYTLNMIAWGLPEFGPLGTKMIQVNDEITEQEFNQIHQFTDASAIDTLTETALTQIMKQFSPPVPPQVPGAPQPVIQPQMIRANPKQAPVRAVPVHPQSQPPASRVSLRLPDHLAAQPGSNVHLTVHPQADGTVEITFEPMTVNIHQRYLDRLDAQPIELMNEPGATRFDETGVDLKTAVAYSTVKQYRVQAITLIKRLGANGEAFKLDPNAKSYSLMAILQDLVNYRGPHSANIAAIFKSFNYRQTRYLMSVINASPNLISGLIMTLGKPVMEHLASAVSYKMMMEHGWMRQYLSDTDYFHRKMENDLRANRFEASLFMVTNQLVSQQVVTMSDPLTHHRIMADKFALNTANMMTSVTAITEYPGRGTAILFLFHKPIVLVRPKYRDDGESEIPFPRGTYVCPPELLSEFTYSPS